MASRRARRRRNDNRTSVWVIGGIVVIAVLALALVILNSNSSASSAAISPPAPAPLDKCGTATCGSPNAPVTIDVYADFQCPYCAQFEPALQQLVPNYIDTGKVKLVYNNFTLIGPESETAAQGAECAGDQNKFWMFAHYLFSRQGAENSGVFTPANVKKMAEVAGLNTSQFNSCLDGGKYSSLISQQKAKGEQLRVKATPTIFVNGKIFEGGLPYSQLAAAIDAAQPK